jgi:hypothetical protein
MELQKFNLLSKKIPFCREILPCYLFYITGLMSYVLCPSLMFKTTIWAYQSLPFVVTLSLQVILTQFSKPVTNISAYYANKMFYSTCSRLIRQINSFELATQVTIWLLLLFFQHSWIFCLDEKSLYRIDSFFHEIVTLQNSQWLKIPG